MIFDSQVAPKILNPLISNSNVCISIAITRLVFLQEHIIF